MLHKLFRRISTENLALSKHRDYFAALLRTNQAYVAPTQGKLLNYVQRVPLGVVAQITVGHLFCSNLIRD